MSPRIATTQKWYLASLALTDAYTDFILSRQAMQCAPTTLEFYKHTAGVFLNWTEGQGITSPEQVDARLVRHYLADLTTKGKSDKTLHAHARAIRTLLRFWHAEKYIPEAVTFSMPKIEKKRLPVLSADELNKVLTACKNPRDKALILFMADSGLRRAEITALNWGDADIMSGLVRVKRGKGGKARSAVIGATTRRALLAYRRTLGSPSNDAPMFISRSGGRFTGTGVLLIFRRLTEKTGIHITPHALRRTFVILSLRAGMDVLHLQAMLGHASLEMVQHYAQMVDDDLLQAHQAHSPMDNLRQLTQ
ncbi:MAG TPA: tyrosine-type recombinase/integrase [Anaerolineales bacterium]|nr:tyrosine-type recombinase/integrase [Anaerolineales bacterium]